MSPSSLRVGHVALVICLLFASTLGGPLQPTRLSKRATRQLTDIVPQLGSPASPAPAPALGPGTAPGSSAASPVPIAAPASPGPGVAAAPVVAPGSSATSPVPIAAPASPGPGVAAAPVVAPETGNATAEGAGNATSTTGGPATATGTIWAIVQSSGGEFDSNSGDYDLFARAVTATNYAKVLTDTHDGKGVTLFAPTDAAFVNSARNLGYQGSDEAGAYAAIVAVLTNITSNRPVSALFDIVGYHILPGSMNAQMLRERTPVPTFQGAQIIIDGFTLRQVASQLPDPQLLGGAVSNRVATNGIMHGIDRLLFPFNIDPSTTGAIVNSAQAPTGNQTINTGGGGGTICFPADATVLLHNGAVVRMRDLNPGDEIQVTGYGKFSPVYLYTHRKLSGMHEFINLITPQHSISLSAQHYIYANGRPVPADTVRIGDVLRTVSGPQTVQRVSRVIEEGLIAPHTMHGDIVVAGCVASSYTALFPPQVAHALLAPVRTVVRAGLAREPLGNLFYNGRPTLEIAAIVRRVLRYAVLHLQIRSG